MIIRNSGIKHNATFITNHSTTTIYQQFQRRRAALPLSPVQPLDLAQKLFLLFAAFEPGFNLEGGVVTAVFSLEPGF